MFEIKITNNVHKNRCASAILKFSFGFDHYARYLLQWKYSEITDHGILTQRNMVTFQFFTLTCRTFQFILIDLFRFLSLKSRSFFLKWLWTIFFSASSFLQSKITRFIFYFFFSSSICSVGPYTFHCMYNCMYICMYIQKEEIFTEPEYNQSSTSEISQATDKYIEFVFTRHRSFFILF